jgi:hypothetical protein
MSENLHRGEERGDAIAWRRWRLYVQVLAVLLLVGAGIGAVILEPNWGGGQQKTVNSLVAELEQRYSDNWLSKLLREFIPEFGKGRKQSEVADDLAALGIEAVPEIIAATRHRLASVRGAAATALGRIGDDRAVAPLADLLARDSQWDGRAAATFALCQLSSPEATAPLIEAMADSNSSIRSWVAAALGRIGGPEATARLIVAMADSDPDVR